jgi:hypothetical protein
MKEFSTKRYMLKHIQKDHRKDYAEDRHKLPALIPDEATNFKVESLYPAGRKVPPGFKAEQLPLAHVRYQVGETKVERVIVAYEDVKRRFPRELCDYYMKKTVLVKRNTLVTKQPCPVQPSSKRTKKNQ